MALQDTSEAVKEQAVDYVQDSQILEKLYNEATSDSLKRNIISKSNFNNQNFLKEIAINDESSDLE